MDAGGKHRRRGARRIDLARSVDQVVALRSARERAFSELVRAGVGGYDLGRITAETNDHLVRRVLALVEAELGRPPRPYCWLGLGSVGRREQTLNTDLDTTLVYGDPPGNPSAEQVRLASSEQVRFAGQALAEAPERCFAQLAERTVAALERCGFPRCQGGIMASNPEWRRPLAAWRAWVDRWVRRPNTDALYDAAIFFDLRPVAGDGSLADRLWSDFLDRRAESSLFTHLLMRGALIHRPPLGLFGRFVVERPGPHHGAFHIKMRGLLPVVKAARATALSQGITWTNTFERLRALHETGVMSDREADELIAAYNFVARLRVHHQVDQLAAGEPIDNFIAPDELPPDERRALKGHFKVIAELAGLIER